MRRTILLVIGAAVAVMFLAGCGGGGTSGGKTGEAAPSLPAGEIVFTRSLKSGGRPSLYVMKPDGSQVRLFVRNAADAAVSADGSRIAFVRGGAVWVMQRSGSQQQRLTSPSGFGGPDPAWSVDGADLYFTRSDEKTFTSSIYSVRVGATGERLVAKAPAGTGTGGYGTCYQGPAPSPDGLLVAFTEFPDCGHAMEAYVRAATEAGRPVELPFQFPGATACYEDPLSTGLAWAPDGLRLAYAVYDQEAQLDCDEDGQFGEVGQSGIFVSKSDGSTPRRLARPATFEDSLYGPAWSSDGNWIAFTRLTDAEDTSASRSELWLVRPDGTGPRRLTDGTPLDSSPAWLPPVR